MMGWFSGGLHPHLTRIFNPTRFCDARGRRKPRARWQRRRWRRISLPLISGLPCTRRATQLDFKVDRYANVVAHHNRLHQRDSVKKALAFEKETMAEFAKA